MVFTQFALFNFAPFVGQIRLALSLTYTQVGLIQTALFLPGVVFQLLAGSITDRYLPKVPIRLSVIIFFVSSVLFGFAGNLTELIILQSMKGATLGVAFVVSVKGLLSQRGSSKDSFSLYASSFAIGPLSTGFSSAILANANVSWRPALLTMNLAGIIPLILVFTINPESWKVRADEPIARSVTAVVKKKETWILAYDQFVRFGAVASFTTWIPVFLTEAFSFSPQAADLTLGSSWILTLASIPVGGILSTRLVSKFLVIETAIFSLLFGTIIVGLLSYIGMPIIGVFFLGAVLNLHLAPLLTILPELFEARDVGLLTGIEGASAYVGALVLPTSFGFVRDSTGSFVTGWFLIGFLAAVGAVLSLPLRKSRRMNGNGMQRSISAARPT